MSADIPILGGTNNSINAFDDDEGVSTSTNLHEKAGRSIIRKPTLSILYLYTFTLNGGVMKANKFMVLESTVTVSRFGCASAVNAILCHSYSDRLYPNYIHMHTQQHILINHN